MGNVNREPILSPAEIALVTDPTLRDYLGSVNLLVKDRLTKGNITLRNLVTERWYADMLQPLSMRTLQALAGIVDTHRLIPDIDPSLKPQRFINSYYLNTRGVLAFGALYQTYEQSQAVRPPEKLTAYTLVERTILALGEAPLKNIYTISPETTADDQIINAPTQSTKRQTGQPATNIIRGTWLGDSAPDTALVSPPNRTVKPDSDLNSKSSLPPEKNDEGQKRFPAKPPKPAIRVYKDTLNYSKQDLAEKLNRLSKIILPGESVPAGLIEEDLSRYIEDIYANYLQSKGIAFRRDDFSVTSDIAFSVLRQTLNALPDNSNITLANWLRERGTKR